MGGYDATLVGCLVRLRRLARRKGGAPSKHRYALGDATTNRRTGPKRPAGRQVGSLVTFEDYALQPL